MTETTLSARTPELVERALALRSEQGYNCAQAVACVLADAVGGDADELYRVSEGFGSGMGGTTETCGALTGASLILSRETSAGIAAAGTTKGRTYKLIRALVDSFREQNTTTVCRELKGIGTGTGVLRTCPGCIEDAIRITCAVLDEHRAGQSA